MTERLSATGKNMLERGRRLMSSHPASSFPRAYTDLLLDPADLLNAAWAGATLTDANPSAAEASEQYAEPTADAARRRPPAPASGRHAPGRADATTPSARAFTPGDRAPLRPAAPAASHTARRAWPPDAPAPLRPHGDSEARRASLKTSPADDSSRVSSTQADRPQTVSAPSKNIRVAVPSGAFARPGSDQTTDSKMMSKGPASSEIPTSVSETGITPKAPAPTDTSSFASESAGVPPRALPRPFKVTAVPPQAAARRTDRASVNGPLNDGERRVSARIPSTSNADAPLLRDEHAPPSALHFAQSPSRLASVLSANLSPTERAPVVLPAATERAAPTTRAERPRRIAAEELVARPGPDARERDAGGVSVEALLEELYERLRLEFLRTYGTSGE